MFGVLGFGEGEPSGRLLGEVLLGGWGMVFFSLIVEWAVFGFTRGGSSLIS